MMNARVSWQAAARHKIQYHFHLVDGSCRPANREEHFVRGCRAHEPMLGHPDPAVSEAKLGKLASQRSWCAHAVFVLCPGSAC